MHSRIHNFGAGPAVLPLPVLEEAQRDLLALPGVGMSVLEISHRSGPFKKVLDEVTANLKQLLGAGDEWEVLFLPGGATLQFAMVPLNLLPAGGSANYIVTGSWSAKAVKEAEKLGFTAHRAWDGKAEGYVRVPAAGEVHLDPSGGYLHYTSNETIHGVEIGSAPASDGQLLVCDASSDFLSRPIDLGAHALIYAGAQKNAGPAGVTIVLVRKELLPRSPANLPSMLSYQVMAAEPSVHNTPPVFPIYVVMLVSRWLLGEIGGLDAMAERNREKAALLYAAIDASDGFYRPHARPDSRSLMNVTWRLPSEELEGRFLAAAKAQGLDGLKGHRSVGGIRASIYNALPRESVEALASFMAEFRAKEA